tara:strand:+ start:169 stop:711 length:543 start_codon:yes stop_codon:yes gene_type:complete
LTPAGQLRIKSIDKIEYEQITDNDIIRAGYNNRKELDKEFALKDKGDIYKIKFELEQADPRIELRENTDISAEEMNDILNKLKRYDTRGKVKNWTFKVLEIVDSGPGKYTIEYATKLGYEKEWFKLNIRKLKNLGLTISLTDGYEISPRGKLVLEKIRQHTANFVYDSLRSQKKPLNLVV